LFNNNAVEAVLEHKWNAYGYKIYWKDALFSLVYLLTFIFNAIFILPHRIKNGDNANKKYILVGIVADVILGLMAAYKLKGEID
jgi:hypothetical protein